MRKIRFYRFFFISKKNREKKFNGRRYEHNKGEKKEEYIISFPNAKFIFIFLLKQLLLLIFLKEMIEKSESEKNQYKIFFHSLIYFFVVAFFETHFFLSFRFHFKSLFIT